jgi:hypothetical protein
MASGGKRQPITNRLGAAAGRWPEEKIHLLPATLRGIYSIGRDQFTPALASTNTLERF